MTLTAFRNIGTGSRYYNDAGELISMSSLVYLPGRCPGDLKWSPLPIRAPQDCEDHTVCVWCIEGWMWDYDLDFTRTVGGRRLAELAALNGVDLTSAARWNAYTETDDDRVRARLFSDRCGSPDQSALILPEATR